MKNEETVYDLAIRHGYDDCGIIPLGDMLGYKDRLDERIKRVPESREFYSRYYGCADLARSHSWAKSILVCVFWIGQYRIPESLRGLYGRHYLTDGRRDAGSDEFQARAGFEKDLSGLGLRHHGEAKFGVTCLRHAALMAGVGIIRKNNFLYTARGSFVSLAAWLIDERLTLKREPSLAPCPPHCTRCVKACTTRSLSAPYTMNPYLCTSFISNFGKGQIPKGVGEAGMGGWLYGCDACQNACPFNRGTETGSRPFPGLDALEPVLQPEALATAEDSVLTGMVQPKLWYITPEGVGLFRENALRVIRHRCSCGENKRVNVHAK